ncbi:MAG: hypothetical protein HUJ95_05385 [Bacteroidales bacterium]|nr:hypothetical protein [Bacteroidales bacterium]
MTYKQMLAIEKPSNVSEAYIGGCKGCPHHYWFGGEIQKCERTGKGKDEETCSRCWSREMPDKDKPIDLLLHLPSNVHTLSIVWTYGTDGVNNIIVDRDDIDEGEVDLSDIKR